jgi:hypothetical protein
MRKKRQRQYQHCKNQEVKRNIFFFISECCLLQFKNQRLSVPIYKAVLEINIRQNKEGKLKTSLLGIDFTRDQLVNLLLFNILAF